MAEPRQLGKDDEPIYAAGDGITTGTPPGGAIAPDRTVDLLLDKLKAVHVDPRFDIAPEIVAAYERRRARSSRRRASA